MKDLLQGRVLLVDDAQGFLHVLTMILERLGFEVTAVDSAQQGLDRIQGGGFDILLTDANMPDLSGRELIAAAADGGWLGEVRCFLITGHIAPDEGEIMTEAIAGCRVQLIPKPVGLKRLRELLAQTSAIG